MIYTINYANYKENSSDVINEDNSERFMYSKKFAHYLEHDRQQENIGDQADNDSNTIPRRLKVTNTITNERAIENRISPNINIGNENLTFGRHTVQQNIPVFVRTNIIKKQDERSKKQASPL